MIEGKVCGVRVIKASIVTVENSSKLSFDSLYHNIVHTSAKVRKGELCRFTTVEEVIQLTKYRLIQGLH